MSVKLNDITFRTWQILGTVYLQSEPEKQPLEKRLVGIFEYIVFGRIEDIDGNIMNSLSMPQIEFMVKATGDWDSNTFEIRDCVNKLVQEGKLKEDNCRFSWNIDQPCTHENEHA